MPSDVQRILVLNPEKLAFHVDRMLDVWKFFMDIFYGFFYKNFSWFLNFYSFKFIDR